MQLATLGQAKCHKPSLPCYSCKVKLQEVQQTCNDLAGKFLTQQDSQAVLQLSCCFVAEGDDHHLPWLAPFFLDQILHPRCQDTGLAAARSSYDPAVRRKGRYPKEAAHLWHVKLSCTAALICMCNCRVQHTWPCACIRLLAMGRHSRALVIGQLHK